MQHRDSHTDAIRLRPVEPDDVPAMFDIQSERESNAMVGAKPRTREVYFAAWKKNLVDPGVNARVIEIDGAGGCEIVGIISRYQADGHDCVGYWIARSNWGKGYASRALQLFLAEERRRPLYATTNNTNTASKHILEKYGFRFVGLRVGEETERFVAREIAEFVLE